MQLQQTILNNDSPVNLVALYRALIIYDRLVSTGQVDPKQIMEGAYIRALYLNEIKNKESKNNEHYSS